MAISSSVRVLNPLEITVLWSPLEEQLSGVLVDNPKFFPCPERKSKKPVYSLAFHSSVVVGSAFNGTVSSSLFLLKESTY